MKSFTDLFIKRPVLALVVSFVILIAGLQAMSDDQRPAISAQRHRLDHGHDGLRRRRCGPRSRIYHHAARARDRGGGRHRLHPIAEHAGHLDHHRAPETELRREQGALGDQLEGEPGPRRSTAGSGNPGHQHRIGRFADRLVLSQFHLGHSAAERDHRLSRATRAAAPHRARRRADSADILGGRTFAMRIWMKPERMAALNISPAQVRNALARNNFLSAVGNTKGSLASGQSDREHRPAHGG